MKTFGQYVDLDFCSRHTNGPHDRTKSTRVMLYNSPARSSVPTPFCQISERLGHPGIRLICGGINFIYVQTLFTDNLGFITRVTVPTHEYY